MKLIGIIGGLGPESTVDYYKRIIEGMRSEGSLAAPEILIYSVDLEEALGLVSRQEWPNLIYLLTAKLKALQRAGADFAVIASNTPHIVFDEVQARSPLPLISIVAATLDKAREMGLKNLGLLGTRFTMRSNFFASKFSEAGIAVTVPTEEDQEYIHTKLMTEIELGIITEETRTGLLKIVQSMVDRDKIDGVILGCTELPLILTESAFGIPFLNTTAIHVESIIERMKR